MDYKIKSIKKFNSGFSFVEIIVVIGIMGILAVATTSYYGVFKRRESLEIATISVVEALRYSQSNAFSGKGDQSWGVKILSDSLVIFKGASYLNRDVATDQLLDFSSGVVASGLSEIVFIKITGSTTNTGTVILTNEHGVKNILINEKGTLTY